MILASTLDTIRVITSSTARLEVQTGWVDVTPTTFLPNRTNTVITNIITTVIVDSPAASTQRQIKNISITNNGVVANTVVVQHYDGVNAIEVFSYTLNIGDIIQYTNTNGWVLLNTNTPIFSALISVTSEPPTPPSNTLIVYSKTIANRMILKQKGPSGLDTPLQVAFWQNNITMWNPTTATAGVWLGTVGAGTGTYSTQLPTSTNLYTAIKRAKYANIVTTLNQVLGQRNTELLYSLGTTAGQGGFFLYTRSGFDVWTNGGRFFAGFATATTVISANPSSLNNTCGFAVDDSDNGLIYFMSRDNSGAITRQSTGFTIVNNRGYDLYVFTPPNGSSIGWKIVDIVSGNENSGTISTNIPTGTAMLTVNVLASNANITTINAVQLCINRIYVETDY